MSSLQSTCLRNSLNIVLDFPIPLAIRCIVFVHGLPAFQRMQSVAFAAQTQTPDLWKPTVGRDANTSDNTLRTITPTLSCGYDILRSGQGLILRLLSGDVHSRVGFPRSLFVCLSALNSSSILPVIAFFSQMPDYLCTLPVNLGPSVVPPSLDRNSPVDCGLRDWVWYILKMTIANGVLLNRYNSERTTDSWLSIGTCSDGPVEAIGNDNTGKVHRFLQSHTLSVHLVSIRFSLLRSYLP